MLDTKPKTIQIYIPEGNPSGIRVADVTSRMIQIIQVPRSSLKSVEKRFSTESVGLYLLIGFNQDTGLKQVYVGEAENVLTRLKQHVQGKDFWDQVIIVNSKSNSFTKAHVKFLEYHFLSQLVVSKSFELVNAVAPQKPNISEQVSAELMDYFETIDLLLSTLGFALFVNPSLENADLVYCKSKKAEASGLFNSDGLLVKKGSKANLDETESIGDWIRNERKNLIQNGVLVEHNSVLIFENDFLFTSPSTAAGVVLGRRANGWIEWKDKKGNTLDSIYRG